MNNTWIISEISNTKSIKDILGTTIRQWQDIEKNLSSYLNDGWLSWYIIEKKASKWDITTISMKPNSEFWCHFEAGWCIIFVLQNNKIIWSNSSSYLQCMFDYDNCVWWHWRFYRYTEDGILLEIQNGEGLGCVDGITYTYQYIHLKELKTIWSTLDIIKEWSSPDPEDERCESKKTIWKEKQVLRFFSSYKNTRNPEKALNIKAKNTEEAYYKYYNQ